MMNGTKTLLADVERLLSLPMDTAHARALSRDQIAHEAPRLLRGLRDALEIALENLEDLRADNQNLCEWKESAIAVMNRWHEVGDELRKRYRVRWGEDIPTALLRELRAEETKARMKPCRVCHRLTLATSGVCDRHPYRGEVLDARRRSKE